MPSDRQVAQKLGISTKTLQRWRKKGLIPITRKGKTSLGKATAVARKINAKPGQGRRLAQIASEKDLEWLARVISAVNTVFYRRRITLWRFTQIANTLKPNEHLCQEELGPEYDWGSSQYNRIFAPRPLPRARAEVLAVVKNTLSGVQSDLIRPIAGLFVQEAHYKLHPNYKNVRVPQNLQRQWETFQKSDPVDDEDVFSHPYARFILGKREVHLKRTEFFAPNVLRKKPLYSILGIPPRRAQRAEKRALPYFRKVKKALKPTQVNKQQVDDDNETLRTLFEDYRVERSEKFREED